MFFCLREAVSGSAQVLSALLHFRLPPGPNLGPRTQTLTRPNFRAEDSRVLCLGLGVEESPGTQANPQRGAPGDLVKSLCALLFSMVALQTSASCVAGAGSVSSPGPPDAL